jgi:hypothetical protein
MEPERFAVGESRGRRTVIHGNAHDDYVRMCIMLVSYYK